MNFHFDCIGGCTSCKAMFTRNEIQPVTEIRPDTILYLVNRISVQMGLQPKFGLINGNNIEPKLLVGISC